MANTGNLYKQLYRLGGIFKAGALVGLITAIIIIAVIVWITMLFRPKS